VNSTYFREFGDYYAGKLPRFHQLNLILALKKWHGMNAIAQEMGIPFEFVVELSPSCYERRITKRDDCGKILCSAAV